MQIRRPSLLTATKAICFPASTAAPKQNPDATSQSHQGSAAAQLSFGFSYDNI